MIDLKRKKKGSRCVWKAITDKHREKKKMTQTENMLQHCHPINPIHTLSLHDKPNKMANTNKKVNWTDETTSKAPPEVEIIDPLLLMVVAPALTEASTLAALGRPDKEFILRVPLDWAA